MNEFKGSIITFKMNMMNFLKNSINSLIKICSNSPKIEKWNLEWWLGVSLPIPLKWISIRPSWKDGPEKWKWGRTYPLRTTWAGSKVSRLCPIKILCIFKFSETILVPFCVCILMIVFKNYFYIKGERSQF